jgi:hypothetical protein
VRPWPPRNPSPWVVLMPGPERRRQDSERERWRRSTASAASSWALSS